MDRQNIANTTLTPYPISGCGRVVREMRDEKDILFTWSDQARADFLMSLPDTAGPEFRRAFAKTIGAGWDGNRDKPLWALAVLIRELSFTDLTLPTAYDLLAVQPVSVFKALRASPRDSVRENSDGTLYIEDSAGRFRIGHTRIRLLQSYLDFLLTCEDCAHGEALLSHHIDPLLDGDTDDPAACASALSKLMYGYRQRHFDDSHASSTYSILRALVKDAGDRITNETPFEIWQDPEKRPYRTYEKCFFALQDYLEVLARAVARSEAHEGLEWSELAPKDDTALSGENALMVEDDAPAGVGETCDAISGKDAVKALEAAELKLFTADERRFLKPVQEAGAFGARLPLATLRLMSLGRIQSAISTVLKTKTSRMPLEARVTCAEAQSYAAIIEELAQMEHKLSKWMKAALAARAADQQTANHMPLHEIVSEGARILAKQRSKTFQKDAATLSALFTDISPALLNASDATRALRKAAITRLGDDPQSQFDQDRLRFAAVLSELYLNPTPASEVSS